MVIFSASYLLKLIVSERASSSRNNCCVKLRKTKKTRNSVHTKCKGHITAMCAYVVFLVFQLDSHDGRFMQTKQCPATEVNVCEWGYAGPLLKTSAILT